MSRRNQSDVCWYFSEGRCRNGQNCRFLHVDPNNSRSSQSGRRRNEEPPPEGYSRYSKRVNKVNDDDDSTENSQPQQRRRERRRDVNFRGRRGRGRGYGKEEEEEEEEAEEEEEDTTQIRKETIITEEKEEKGEEEEILKKKKKKKKKKKRSTERTKKKKKNHHHHHQKRKKKLKKKKSSMEKIDEKALEMGISKEAGWEIDTLIEKKLEFCETASKIIELINMVVNNLVPEGINTGLFNSITDHAIQTIEQFFTSISRYKLSNNSEEVAIIGYLTGEEEYKIGVSHQYALKIQIRASSVASKKKKKKKEEEIETFPEIDRNNDIFLFQDELALKIYKRIIVSSTYKFLQKVSNAEVKAGTTITKKEEEEKDNDDNKEKVNDKNIVSKCQKCENKVAKKRCTRCKSVFYCSRECQMKDWKNHKSNCVEQN